MNILKLDTAAIGRPITRFGVSFFPVYLLTNKLPEILTEGLIINEPEAEKVSRLLVRNPTEKPILVVEGERLVGGKQNRVVNTTVLVPPSGELEIPVSRIEQGLWGQRQAYNPSFTHQTVRSMVVEIVNASMQQAGFDRSNQSTVWKEVDNMLDRLEVQSNAAEEIYRRDDSLSKVVAELVRLGPLPGQNGIVVTHGTWVKVVDIFGSPDLLAHYWSMLIRSHLLEAPANSDPYSGRRRFRSNHSLEAMREELYEYRPDKFLANHGRWDTPANPSTHSAERVLRAIRRFGLMDQISYPGIGMGLKQRMMDQIMVGESLMLDEMIVYANMFTKT